MPPPMSTNAGLVTARPQRVDELERSRAAAGDALVRRVAVEVEVHAGDHDCQLVRGCSGGR